MDMLKHVQCDTLYVACQACSYSLQMHWPANDTAILTVSLKQAPGTASDATFCCAATACCQAITIRLACAHSYPARCSCPTAAAVAEPATNAVVIVSKPWGMLGSLCCKRGMLVSELQLTLPFSSAFSAWIAGGCHSSSLLMVKPAMVGHAYSAGASGEGICKVPSGKVRQGCRRGNSAQCNEQGVQNFVFCSVEGLEHT